MILGRPAALWAGLAAAGINVLVFVANIPWNGQQVAMLNAFALSLIGVMANVSVTGKFIGRYDESDFE